MGRKRTIIRGGVVEPLLEGKKRLKGVKSGEIRKRAYSRKGATKRLVLERRLVHACDGGVWGLGETLRGGIVVLGSIGAAGVVIIRIMQTLLGGAVGEGEGGDVRGRGGHYRRREGG
jgi:hypothetical protein